MKKIIDGDGFNAVVQARHGYIIFNKNDIYIGKSIEKYGEYSERELSILLQLCREGDVVVEVGANIGTHTLAIAGKIGKTGRIYAFEPQRIVFQTLCANMALNSIENTECYQMGASSENGYLLIPDMDNHAPRNHGGMQIEHWKEGHRVPIVRLDDFLVLPKLKLLKVDVEGMEAKVLKGSEKIIKKFNPVLYVENDRREKSKELIELIWSLEYDAYWHLPALFNQNNLNGDPENLFPGIVSVNMLCIPKDSDIAVMNLNKILDSSEHPLTDPSVT